MDNKKAQNQKESEDNSSSILSDSIGKIEELLGGKAGGEFIAGFMASTLYIYIQIASTISKHMAVAFKIPSDTTGIYFTKLFGGRGLVSVAASILTYLIKLFISEDNIIITLVFCSLMLISRTVFIFFLHIDKNRALYIYNVLIMDGLCVGLFSITFYPLTTEYVSVLSLCFKITRLWIFVLQLFMDMLIYDKPMMIVKIHYWFAYIFSLISTVLWFYYCIGMYNKNTKKRRRLKPKTDSEPKSQNRGENDCNSGSGQQAENSEDEVSQSIEDKVKQSEPSFLTHLRNSFSPLMMCFVTLMMKNILYPGLLPYGLLERDKCHIINMVITPVGLLGTSIVYALKKNVESINRIWDWYWHLLWFVAIPPAIIFYKTIVALHPRSSSARSKIINNRKDIFIMAVVLFMCHSLIESAGYLGVVSNVKHCNEVRERGRKMVSTNQLLAEIINLVFYKLSVGYNVTRISLGYHLPKFRPIHRMSRKNLCAYLIRNTFLRGFEDFIDDFKMNIQKYI